jgi:hypothetical protein
VGYIVILGVLSLLLVARIALGAQTSGGGHTLTHAIDGSKARSAPVLLDALP